MRVSLATPPKTGGPTRARPLNSFKAPLLGTRERGGSDDHSTLARASLVLGGSSSVGAAERPRARSEADQTGTERGMPHGWAAVPQTLCPGSGRNYTVGAYQSIGDRKTQEDRYTLVPRLDPSIDVVNSFFGVFDGTVGDFASHTVKDIVVPKLLESPSWKAFRQGHPSPPEEERLLSEAFHDMYRSADSALLAQCARHTQHYATCTSVTVLIVGDLLVVGHLGDSRVILVKEEEPGVFVGEQLTVDHKPDLDTERQRIEQCGGMVERLQNHGNKPFIRGGDFIMRKALGEQPMQLQYSRAFGAKDLKIFGLSCVPDVKVIRMGSSSYKHVRFLVLASDGLWDVMSATEAARRLQEAVAKHEHPAEVLVHAALQHQVRLGGRADNITAVTVQFDQ